MLLICLLAFLGSVLTFFSGFGLGTILLPAFALVFPLDISIALTGIVHLSNNLFKYFLVKKDADYKIIFRFGIPAIIAAWVGAWIMGSVSKMPELLSYYIGVNEYKIEPFKVIVGALIIFFTSLDYLPQTKTISFSARFLPIGGFLSGFFGGISGHQGALRSMFLLRSGM
ncbi:MAG: sulfite exporter TauE/SafE family protein [Oligoflexales bacterium]|nr:sulfite exporter TauE/SafE family protein [Oligoflexales bacterium]